MALTSGAHEAISMVLGDSIQPRFSVKTDTVLKVVGQKIVAAKCGNSFIFLRTFRGALQVTADTIAVSVPCAAVPDTTSPPDTTVESVEELCLFPVDSAVKYKIDGSKSLSQAQHDLIQPWCINRPPISAADRRA